MNEIEFEGEYYRDDRMYVLYVCRCTIDEQENLLVTNIYHEDAPADSKWCLVTYRNVNRYTPIRADHFETEIEATTYMRQVEPTVPLISQGGSPMCPPLTYEEFVRWKKKNKFKEYDYKEMYTPGVTNPMESIFQGINQESKVNEKGKIASYKQANLGTAYGELGKYEEAIESYKQAIRIDPDVKEAHYNLGTVYIKSGKYQEAIESYKQAIRIDPDFADAHHNLGTAYGELGKHQEAIESFKHAIRIDPDHAGAHKNLGVAYVELNKRNSALEQYKILKKLDTEKANKLFNKIYK
jgi:tetratricopeptide (TPR) repeat protein